MPADEGRSAWAACHSTGHRMSQRARVWVLLFAVSGCGRHVPEIQEFWGTPDDTQVRVNAIAGQVDCELREGMRRLLKNDTAHRLDFLKTWGAQAQLILTVDEKTAVNPSLSLTSPFGNSSQTVSVGFGGAFSADATRIDKVTYFYDFRRYLRPDSTADDPTPDPDDPSKDLSCIPGAHDTGTFFVYSDLKLRQLLSDALVVKGTGTGDIAKDKQVISHEVKFNIVSDGNITPTWKLVRVTANASGIPFFDAKRDRTQDLIITLGPTQTTDDMTSLAPVAQSSANASEFGASVAAQLRNLQIPTF